MCVFHRVLQLRRICFLLTFATTLVWSGVSLHAQSSVLRALQTDQGRANLNGLSFFSLSRRATLAKILQHYDLTAELRLTEKQVSDIKSIDSLEQIEFYGSISETNPIEMSEEQFDDFLRELRRLRNAHDESVNERVEEILDRKQMSRLRQIGSQLYVLKYRNAKHALAYAGIEVSDDVLPIIQAELRKFKNMEGIAADLLAFRDRLLAIRDIVGASLDRRIGDLFAFGVPLEKYPDMKELYFEGFDRKLEPVVAQPFTLHVISLRHVQVALELSAKQSETVTTVLEEWKAAKRESQPTDTKTRESRLVATQKELLERIRPVLSRDQRQRAGEITLQYVLREVRSAEAVASLGFRLSDKEIAMLNTAFRRLEETPYELQTAKRRLAYIKQVFAKHVGADRVDDMFGPPFVFQERSFEDDLQDLRRRVGRSTGPNGNPVPVPVRLPEQKTTKNPRRE